MGDSIASVPTEPIANEINSATNTSSAGTEDTSHSFAPPVGTGSDLQAQFQTGTSNLAPSCRRPAQHRTTSSFTIGSSARNQTNHHTTMSGDVEALLRQWGGGDSSTTGDLGNTAHSDGFVSSVVRAETVVDGGRDPIANILRGPLIDEESTAIDFDSEQESLDSADGGLALNSTVTSRHRRIASAGGITSIPMGDLNLSSPSRGLDRVMSERVGMTIHRTQSDDLEGVALHSLDGRSSAIHDAARITNWSLVASLSKTDPEAAKYAGPDRWTALHHACSRRCPHADVIDCLLRAYPEALLQTDDRGWNPLHHACRFKAPREVIRLLLRAYPELGKRAAAARCSMGRSPLYYAIRYDAPDGVVDMLLYADPGAVLDEDRDGVCPLGLVWDKYATGFEGKRTLHTLLKPFEGEGWELGGGAGNAHGSTNVEAMSTREAKLAAAEKKVKSAMQRPTCKHLRAKWQKVNSLLRAYFHFPLQDDDGTEDIDNANELTQRAEHFQGNASTSFQNLEISSTPKIRKWRVLHAVSAIKCHHMLFLLARALHPEEAQEIDENDLLGGGREVTAIPDPPSLSLDRQPISSRTALHFAAMSPLSGKEGRNVIKILLSLNPGAAKHTDGYGCLPLHLISQNDRKVHWTQDGLRDIYISYPDATSCKDSIGRTPLHCAASAAGHYLRPPPSPTQAARPRSPIAAAEEPNPQANLELDTARDVGSVIQNLVLVNRNAASVADKTGRLPLHYIAEYAEEWTSDAECILAAHVAAARSRAGPLASGRLPLHMAASSTDARPSLIMNLVHANPRAASLVDGTGRLPLHLACESGRTTWDRGIESIYSAFTRAISMPEDSSRKWTVLHTAAASSSAGCELIETILKLHPNSASMADGQGKYPLHLACAANRSWEDGGVRILFEADPSVALVEDNRGLLPFHLTAMRSSEEAIHRDITADTDNNIELGDDSADDLSTLEVLYNLLAAQPSITPPLVMSVKMSKFAIALAFFLAGSDAFAPTFSRTSLLKSSRTPSTGPLFVDGPDDGSTITSGRKEIGYDSSSGRFFETNLEPEECIPDDEYCIVDKETGELVRLTLEEKERIFLDALQSYYVSGRQMLNDAEFDLLKEDLSWNGSDMVKLNRKEAKFLAAMKAYQKGEPMISDAEFDELKAELKEEGSQFASTKEPRCYIDSGICRVTYQEDNFRTNLLYLPVGAILTTLWLGFGFEVIEPIIRLNPLILMALGAPLIYKGSIALTDDYIFQNNKIVYGPCPACETENRVYFGDILGVEGFGDVASIKCTKCKVAINVQRESLRASTLPKND